MTVISPNVTEENSHTLEVESWNDGLEGDKARRR